MLRWHSGEGGGRKKEDRKKERKNEKKNNELVSWCFEPSQPQRITSGLCKRRLVVVVVVGVGVAVQKTYNLFIVYLM